MQRVSLELEFISGKEINAIEGNKWDTWYDDISYIVNNWSALIATTSLLFQLWYAGAKWHYQTIQDAATRVITWEVNEVEYID